MLFSLSIDAFFFRNEIDKERANSTKAQESLEADAKRHAAAAERFRTQVEDKRCKSEDYDKAAIAESIGTPFYEGPCLGRIGLSGDRGLAGRVTVLRNRADDLAAEAMQDEADASRSRSLPKRRSASGPHPQR
jgi:hypothetical protein